MNSEYIYLIIALVIIIILFFGINMLLKKNIERYGIYCGRYNIDKSSARRRCKGDIECTWNEYTSRTGIPAGWCGQSPKGVQREFIRNEDD